jgi:acetolactate synthase I/II/III large subunit
MDSVPLVVISGQVPVPAIGMDAFQEVDMVGVTRPCVKHNFLIKDVKDIASTIKKAFYIAKTGRPGPVVVDVPKDITAHVADFLYPKSIEMRSYSPILKGHSGQIKKAIKLLSGAKRPMIYAGGGVVLGNGSEELVKLARALNFPVTNTLMGLGGYPATDNQFVGMLGMHGTYEANMAMQNCDVLIAIGARFDDRVIGNPKHFASQKRTIIHIDVDPSSISKRVRVDVPIVGHVESVLSEMNEMLAQEHTHVDISDWWKQINEWRGVHGARYEYSSDVIKPQYVIEKLWEVTKGDAYITSDVGQHQMWAAQYYKFDKPRRWINSGGLGTMGVGLPYAMGCQFADKNAQVACVTGEGSIQMNIQELSTCAQYGLPIKVILLNNRYLGMVRQWQEFFYENRYSESYMDSLPDFVKLAESYGHVGMKITQPSDVEGALKEAFAKKDKFVFMDFITDQSENVFPMVENGKGLSQMILGNGQEETK